MPSTDSSTTTRDRSARRVLEVTLLLLVVAEPALARYRAGTVAADWLVGSFLVTLVLTGPVALSAVGRRVGGWFREIGLPGRIVVIAVVAGAGISLIDWLSLSNVIVDSAVVGGLAGVLVVVLVRWAGLVPPGE